MKRFFGLFIFCFVFLSTYSYALAIGSTCDGNWAPGDPLPPLNTECVMECEKCGCGAGMNCGLVCNFPPPNECGYICVPGGTVCSIACVPGQCGTAGGCLSPCQKCLGPVYTCQDDQVACESESTECYYFLHPIVPITSGSYPDFDYGGVRFSDLQAIITPIAKILYYTALVVGVIFIIYSGYMIMTSEGNPQRVQQGQEQLTAAILGITFILLSAAILRVIITSILGA